MPIATVGSEMAINCAGGDIVLTARVVCREPPLTLASGAQIWATDWFLCKKKGPEALFDPHLAYFGYLIVI